MSRNGWRGLFTPALLVAIVVGAPAGLLLGSASAVVVHTQTQPTTLPNSTFVTAPPVGASGPDDITMMSAGGWDSSPALIWTNYQNGINPNGTAGKSGATQSVIAGYDPTTGALVKSINVTGKVDGMAADPQLGKIVATVNEDANSAIYLVDPSSGTAMRFNYTPSPEVNGNGGTDSVSIWGGNIFVTHSNPNDTTQAAEYEVNLAYSTQTAYLTPLFYDNSVATDALSGSSVTMALTDPDTNFVMPSSHEWYAGQLATVSQGDGKIIFASGTGYHATLTVLNLSDNVSGNVPPIDGMAVATSGHGTLYVVDAGNGQIQALSTNGWPAGTVFVGEPKDNGNPLVGTLNLATGVITPLGNHFVSPKGLLFVPAHPHGDDNGQGDDGQGDNGQGDQNSQGWGDDSGNGQFARSHDSGAARGQYDWALWGWGQ